MKRFVLPAFAACLVLSAVSARSASAIEKVSAMTLTPTSNAPVQGALYPCPKPDIPSEVGWTLITNPAFHPYEMTYAHSYRALYPPYYYKNTHGLSCLPFFPKPHLVGTEVRVKYSSHYPFGAGLHYLPHHKHYHNNQSHTWYANSSWNHRTSWWNY